MEAIIIILIIVAFIFMKPLLDADDEINIDEYKK